MKRGLKQDAVVHVALVVKCVYEWNGLRGECQCIGPKRGAIWSERIVSVESTEVYGLTGNSGRFGKEVVLDPG